jgi:hypothetical protein
VFLMRVRMFCLIVCLCQHPGAFSRSSISLCEKAKQVHVCASYTIARTTVATDAMQRNVTYRNMRCGPDCRCGVFVRTSDARSFERNSPFSRFRFPIPINLLESDWQHTRESLQPQPSTVCFLLLTTTRDGSWGRGAATPVVLL